MRINNNIPAMTTLRFSGNIDKDLNKSIKSLSSGKRINSASDDAAGLTISKKMRAQIRGLNQANNNIQDGISLIQTAEGALNSVHSLVQRGRELAVQASNDTLNSEEKNIIQNEIDQITSEVDSISKNTEFNNLKLLNVSSVTPEDKQAVVDSLTGGILESAANLVNTYYGLNESTRTVNVVLENGSAGGTLASVRTSYSLSGDTATVVGMTLNIDMTDFAPGTGPDGENALTTAGGSMYNDRIIAHEMVHAIMADQMGDDFYDMPTWFKEGTAEFIHGADDRVEADGLAASVARAAQLIDGSASWSGTSLDYSASYIAVKFIQNNLNGGRTMAHIMSDIQDGDNANDNTLGAIISNTTFSNVGDFKTQLAAGGAAIMNITPGPGETDTGSIGGSDHGGSAKTASSVVPTGSSSANPTNFNFVMPSAESIAATSKSKLTLQVGANTDESITIDLTSTASSDLGIDTLDLVNSAQAAITAFDDAISKVSTQRSTFGALQNRLNHALKSSQNYSENLQAAESRITDVDMAKEMMTFTKKNVLKQAAQSMLAQANQTPRGVLQLIA